MKDSPSVLSLGRLCHELGCSYSWPSGEAPRLSKGKKEIECCIEHFVPVVAATKQKVVPSIELSSSKGNFEREKEVEDTLSHPSHLQKEQKHTMHLPQLQKLGVTLSMLSRKNLLMTNFSRLSPMREEILLAKDTKSKKRNHRFPTKRNPQCVHSISASPN